MSAGSAVTIRTKGARPYNVAKRVAVHSRRIALGDIDGRLREARLIREITDELTAHCGNNPSAVQRRLIQRAAILHLRLALMDEQTEPDGSMTEKHAREYLCWNNAYCRTLRHLGLKGASTGREPSLADILAAERYAAPLPTPESLRAMGARVLPSSGRR
jgi:hypothetical protein